MVENDIFFYFDVFTSELHLNALYHNTERGGDRSISTSHEMKWKRQCMLLLTSDLFVLFLSTNFPLLDFLFLAIAQAME
jgi:hypothetical protein